MFLFSYYSLAFMLLVCLCHGHFMKNKPDYLQRCQLTDSTFKVCMAKNLRVIISKMFSGFDGLIDLPSMDPMHMSELNIFQGSGPVSLNAKLKDVVVTGVSAVKLISSDFNMQNFTLISKLAVPKLRIASNFTVNGRMLIIPLVGSGDFWIEADNLNTTMYSRIKIYKKEEHFFFNITSLTIDYEFSAFRVRVNNLFHGVQPLEDKINDFFNANWKTTTAAFKPIMSNTVATIMRTHIQKVFDYIPAEFFLSMPTQNLA